MPMAVGRSVTVDLVHRLAIQIECTAVGLAREVDFVIVNESLLWMCENVSECGNPPVYHPRIHF
jgi:hypothetical protein